VKELLIETLVDLPAEYTIELMPSLAVMRASLSLRSSDIYDLLRLFLQQKIGLLIVQSTIGPVFSRDNLSRHVTCVLFEVPLTTTGWSRKSVPPLLLWFSHDTSVLIPRPPPWRVKIRDMVLPGCAYLLTTTTFIGDECFQAGDNDGKSDGSDLLVFIHI